MPEVTPGEPEKFKRCPTCKHWMRLDAFEATKYSKDRLSSRCSQCIDRVHQTGSFVCRSCQTIKPGREFERGKSGNTRSSDCFQCKQEVGNADFRRTQLPSYVRQAGAIHRITRRDAKNLTAKCAVCGPDSAMFLDDKTKTMRCWNGAVVGHERFIRDVWEIDTSSIRIYHRVKTLQREDMTGFCTRCEQRVAIRWGNSGRHFICINPDFRFDKQRASLKRRLYVKYGMTVGDYNDLLKKQNGMCAICLLPPGKQALRVDHDHDTNEVRGLLCGTCNSGIGHLRDDVNLLKAAIEYLQDPPALNGALGK